MEFTQSSGGLRQKFFNRIIALKEEVLNPVFKNRKAEHTKESGFDRAAAGEGAGGRNTRKSIPRGRNGTSKDMAEKSHVVFRVL